MATLVSDVSTHGKGGGPARRQGV